MPHRHWVQPEASAPADGGGPALPRPTSLDPSKYASTAFLDRAVQAAQTDRDRSDMTTAYNRCEAPQLSREPECYILQLLVVAVTACTDSLTVRSGACEKPLSGMESFCSCGVQAALVSKVHGKQDYGQVVLGHGGELGESSKPAGYRALPCADLWRGVQPLHQ